MIPSRKVRVQFIMPKFEGISVILRNMVVDIVIYVKATNYDLSFHEDIDSDSLKPKYSVKIVIPSRWNSWPVNETKRMRL